MRLVVLGFAAVFIVAGLVMGAVGFTARGEVTQALVDERLKVPNPQVLLTYPGARAPEGVEVPTVLIDTPELAVAQAKVIQTHTLAITGGKTYSEMDREDPARATSLTAVTLRSALMQARLGFDISLLVMGLGALFVLSGTAIGVIYLVSRRRVAAQDVVVAQRVPAPSPA